MTRLVYYVGPDNGRWFVQYKGTPYGPYYTQASAIEAAVNSAHANARLGIDSQVLVKGADGRFRAEWTYGNDPFPPKG